MTRAAPRIAWLAPGDPPDAFPPVETAVGEPNGLLAAGGDLSVARLLYAYRHSIFPWYEEGQPILWWSPDPRCILEPAAYHVSRRTRRALRTAGFSATVNRAFDAVVERCAHRRPVQTGTWITAAMKTAFGLLHQHGWAHSVEIWHEDELAGGVYGLAIGRAFFGESMFSGRDNGSKAALLVLCRELVRLDIALLDCQVVSPHLLSLGASTLARRDFAARLEDLCVAETQRPFPGYWRQPITAYL